MADLGIAHIFHVRIDNVDIGAWTGCKGLTANYEVQEYEEGGQNLFVHKLPGRLRYDNITLTRSVGKSSGEVAAWFNKLSLESITRGTASITLYDADLEEVATWSVSGVVPIKWTGPNLEAGSNSVAEETLELAHHGFTYS